MTEDNQSDYQWGAETYNPASGTHCVWAAGKTISGPQLDPVTDSPSGEIDMRMRVVHPIDLTDCEDAKILYQVFYFDTHEPFDGNYCAWNLGKHQGAPVLDPAAINNVPLQSTILRAFDPIEFGDYQSIFLVIDYKGEMGS